MRSRNAIPSFLVISALLAACVDQPTSVATPRGIVSAKGAPQPSIPLVVTVLESPGAKVHSDAGAYTSGLDGMTAELDGTGNLQFTPANASSTVAPRRTLVLDYSSQVSGAAYSPNMAAQHNFKIKTTSANPRIQDLAVSASECVAATIATETGGAAIPTVHHRAVFNVAAAPGSTYARVTRTSSTAWTMVSDGSCAGAANIAGVWSQDLTSRNAPLVFRGNYSVNFSLGFVVKP